MKSLSNYFMLTLLFLAIAPSSSFAAAGVLIQNAKQPQLALDEKGAIHLAFGRGDSIFVASSSDNTASFKDPVLVGTVSRLALGMRRGPRIVATPNSLVITSISLATGSLHSWFSTDEGKSWTAGPIINEVDRSAREGLHALASNTSGELFSVWLDLRNGRMELWGARGLDGGKTWEPNVKIYASPEKSICECCHPSVLMQPNGEIIAMWRNSLKGNRDMYVAKSVDHGKTFPSATKLGKGSWKLFACPMDGGGIASMGDKVATVWRRESKIFSTTLNESEEELLSPGGTQPIVVGAGDHWEFFWQSGGSIVRRSSSSSSSEVVVEEGVSPSALWIPRLQKTILVWETQNGIGLKLL